METNEVAVLENEAILVNKTFNVCGTEEPFFRAMDAADWIEIFYYNDDARLPYDQRR